MSNRDASRRILGRFGAPDQIGATSYTVSDLKLFGPAFVLLIVILGATPTQYRWVGFLLGGGVLLTAAALIYFAPPHRVAHEWVLDQCKFQCKDRIMTPHDSETADTDAQNLTNVERFLRIDDSVKRTDGAIVGAVQVHPANMALATERRWATATDEFGRFINSLPFEIQIHSTARPADPDRLTRAYENRAEDPDVKQNSELRQLIDVYNL